MLPFRTVEEALQAHFIKLKQSLANCKSSLDLIKLETELQKAKDLVERMETETSTVRYISQRSHTKTLITSYNKDLVKIEQDVDSLRDRICCGWTQG